MLDTAAGREVDASLLRLLEAVRASGYDFVTPTPATIARVNARPENEWAGDLRGVLGWSRPFREGTLSLAILRAMHEAGVLMPVPGGHRSLIRCSTLDGFLFAHSAYPTVEADAVFFGPDTYRFAACIARASVRNVRRAVDLGCGAGPGALVVAKRWPGADVLAVDINVRALRLAAVNAALAGLPIECAASNLLDGVEGAFDLIVANPPYLVDGDARTYRHGGGPLGAELSLKIIATAIDRLQSGGTLLLYTGAAVVEGVDRFRREADALLAETGLRWTYEELDPDVFGEELEQGVYAQADRIAAVLLTAVKTG